MGGLKTIKELPSGLYVGGTLWMNRTNIQTLPPDLISGRIAARYSKLTTWNKKTTVGFSMFSDRSKDVLYISDTPLGEEFDAACVNTKHKLDTEWGDGPKTGKYWDYISKYMNYVKSDMFPNVHGRINSDKYGSIR